MVSWVKLRSVSVSMGFFAGAIIMLLECIQIMHIYRLFMSCGRVECEDVMINLTVKFLRDECVIHTSQAKLALHINSLMLF